MPCFDFWWQVYLFALVFNVLHKFFEIHLHNNIGETDCYELNYIVIGLKFITLKFDIFTDVI